MPKLLGNKRLSIKRFWIPYGLQGATGKPLTLHLTDGILPDPDETYGKITNSSLATLEQIESKRCFALLGQPGLGKSIAVEEWVNCLKKRAGTNDLIALLRGRQIAGPEEIWRVTVDSPQWKQARQNDGEITLILDGLDEALQRLPVIVGTLQQCLNSEPISQTRVILVSRVADWRDSRAEELFALWPESERGGAFELCPLRWKDIRLSAHESGFNEDAFTRAVTERRVAWMAGRPKLLLMLLEEYRKHRRLPDSRGELFGSAALGMCVEHDPERHEVLERSARPIFPATQVYAVVARIAALLLMSGKSYVQLADSGQVTALDLSVDEIIGGCELAGTTEFEVEKAHVLAALDSSHFVACGPGRLGFDHQAMVEFMAAEYLKRCTTPQLRSLLTQRIDGVDFLLPQFREVSAWIAVQHPDFCSYLLTREPRFLLDADAVELDEKTRQRAVAALLAQMDREEAFDSSVSETFLKSLHHSQLARQLRPFIVDEARNVVVRRNAIRLAGAARCKSLKADLWNLLEHPQQVSIRNAAIDAACEMATAADKARFINILRNDVDISPDDDLKGEALKFLVPRHLPVRAIISYIVPLDDDRYGTYWQALTHYLPAKVRDGDVLPILHACNRRGESGKDSGPLKQIADAAVKLAFRNFKDPRIRQACIRFLGYHARIRGWDETWETVRSFKLSTGVENKLRRVLIEEFVKKSKGNFSEFLQFGLWPNPDELGWILECLINRKGGQRNVWANLAARLSFQPIKPTFRNALVAAYENVDALKKLLPKPRRFSLLETIDRRRRAIERQSVMWNKRNLRRQAKQAARQLTIAKCLEYFRKGHACYWPKFTLVLRRVKSDEEKSGSSQGTHSRDLATWYGWTVLPSADKKLVRKIAAQFLFEAPVPSRELGKIFEYDEAAVYAIVLLRSSLMTNLSLRESVRDKWVRAILHGIYNNEPELDAIAALAYRLNQRVCLEYAHEEMAYRDSQNVEHTSLRQFKRCWDAALTNAVTTCALKSKQPRTVLRTIMLLRDVAQQDALELWHVLSKRIKGFGKFDRTITFIGLMAFPKEAWKTSFARLKNSRRGLQIRFFVEHLGWLDYEFRDWASALTNKQLADLYLLLVDLFPPSTLNDYSTGGTIKPREHVGDTQRVCIGVLVQRGTAESCAELKRISESVPAQDRIWVRWRLREAIDQRLRTEWLLDQPTSASILRMGRTASAIRVRDAGELQEAVLASLSRLQAAMHLGAYPKIRSFWREPGRIPQEEREVSRNLAEWLERDLRGDAGIVVDREPQIGWKGHTDLKIEIPPNAALKRPRLVVVVEVKRCLHPEVTDACESQLAEGYLRRKNLTHGIYLISWFGMPKSGVKWATLDAAKDQVSSWATEASKQSLNIRGIVLDCRWHGMEAPSRL